MNIRFKEPFLNNPNPGSLTLELPWNLTTPVAAYERVARGPYSFLLESAKETDKRSRYSFLGTEPNLVLETKGSRVEMSRGGRTTVGSLSPLAHLEDILNEISTPKLEGLPPFVGGGVGLFSYDLVRLFEKLPRFAVDDLNCPDLHLMFVDTVIAFDHSAHTVQIIYTPPQKQILNTDRKILYEIGVDKIKRIEERLKGSFPNESPDRNPGRNGPPESNLTKPQYLERVRRCKEYIAAGDIYQANLSQRFSVPFRQSAWSLYKILREINPAPFAGFLQLGELQLVSASPERLVRLGSGMLETRPIAGTRPTGNSPREKRGMRAELLASEKERAEHLMLVDLERNDLGKVCRYGSVRVNEFMATETYSHVIHIVSNIRGEISPGKKPLDVIRAVFPGGTITGVPKIRCMEIIEELEPAVRGPYTGSFGYISSSGEMDLNLIIRTFIIKNQRAYVQVGGGIVADSEPDQEYNETLIKAEALLLALSKLQ
jgi:anthranilate/para-aminobenzoate synthase component I